MLYRGEETAFAVELIARNVHVNVANNPCPLNEELKWPTPSFDFAFLLSLSFSFFFFLIRLHRGRFSSNSIISRKYAGKYCQIVRNINFERVEL